MLYPDYEEAEASGESGRQEKRPENPSSGPKREFSTESSKSIQLQSSALSPTSSGASLLSPSGIGGMGQLPKVPLLKCQQPTLDEGLKPTPQGRPDPTFLSESRMGPLIGSPSQKQSLRERRGSKGSLFARIATSPGFLSAERHNDMGGSWAEGLDGRRPGMEPTMSVESPPYSKLRANSCPMLFTEHDFIL